MKPGNNLSYRHFILTAVLAFMVAESAVRASGGVLPVAHVRTEEFRLSDNPRILYEMIPRIVETSSSVSNSNVVELRRDEDGCSERVSQIENVSQKRVYIYGGTTLFKLLGAKSFENGSPFSDVDTDFIVCAVRGASAKEILVRAWQRKEKFRDANFKQVIALLDDGIAPDREGIISNLFSRLDSDTRGAMLYKLGLDPYYRLFSFSHVLTLIRNRDTTRREILNEKSGKSNTILVEPPFYTSEIDWIAKKIAISAVAVVINDAVDETLSRSLNAAGADIASCSKLSSQSSDGSLVGANCLGSSDQIRELIKIIARDLNGVE